MKALIPVSLAIFGSLASCGSSSDSGESRFAGESSRRGRLMCSATLSAPATGSIVGCTDANQLYAANANGTMAVTRVGTELQISLRNLKAGIDWSGRAQLRMPSGGTGTRARVFIQPNGFQLFGCEFDSLLSCNR